ncbi:MAG: adenylate kinase [Pyrinomonadaceae bacterium]
MSKIIVLMGAPGAGKGTQARLLRERRGLPQISTGDIFRAMKDAQTPLGEEVRAVMSAGGLVPDGITIRVVEERTSADDCKAGYILDGFPRTTVQATMLETLAADQGHRIHAVFVDVPFEILERRMTGRRNCPVCGEIYNVYFKPPRREGVCDLHPEVALNHRADDNAATVKTRLATYERDTQPLLDYYAASQRLDRVNGTREPEAVYADVEKTVTSDK